MSNGMFAVYALILVGAVLAGAYFLGGHTGSAVPTSTNPSPGSVSLNFSGGACKTGSLEKIGLVAGYENQQQNNANTSASVQYNITAVPTTGYSLGAGQTSANGVPVWNNQSVICGGTYQVEFSTGKSTSYYMWVSQPFTVRTNSTIISTSQLQKTAQLQSVQFANTSGGTYYSASGNTNVITAGKFMTAGATATFYEQFNTGAGSYGGNSTLESLIVNSTSIQNAQIYEQAGGSYTLLAPSVSQPPNPSPNTYNVPTGFQSYWFRLPAMNQWSTTYGPYKIVLTAGTTFTSNTDVNVAVNDNPGELLNGAPSFPNGGIDPNSKADLGQAMLMYGPTTAFNGISGPSGPIVLNYN